MNQRPWADRPAAPLDTVHRAVRPWPGWAVTATAQAGKALLAGSLKFGHLARLVPDASGGACCVDLSWCWHRACASALRQGPDGWLYLLTDATNGQLLRLLPAAGQATVSSAITPVAVLEMGMW